MITLDQAKAAAQELKQANEQRDNILYDEQAPILIARFNHDFKFTIDDPRAATMDDILPATSWAGRMPAIKLDDDHALTWSPGGDWMLGSRCPVCHKTEEKMVYRTEGIVAAWTSTPTEKVLDEDEGTYYYPWKCKACVARQQRLNHPVLHAIEIEEGDQPRGSYGRAIAIALYYILRELEERTA